MANGKKRAKLICWNIRNEIEIRTVDRKCSYIQTYDETMLKVWIEFWTHEFDIIF